MMEKAKAIFGGFVISCILGVYGIYMYFNGGDGAIFGTVLMAIGVVAGGIAGFEFGLKKTPP